MKSLIEFLVLVLRNRSMHKDELIAKLAAGSFTFGLGLLMAIGFLFINAFVAGGLLLIGLSFIDNSVMSLLPEVISDLSWGDAAAICFCSGILFKGSTLVQRR